MKSFILAVSLLFLVGCGDSDEPKTPVAQSPTDEVQISGSIPTDKIAYTPDTMDKLFAFIGIKPLFADYVGAANQVIVMTPDFNMVKKDINSNGTFSVDIDKAKSNAIFLVNDNTKEVVGSVSIPVTSGSDITLDMMPKGKVASDLDLGELTINTNTGIATTSTVNVGTNLGDDNTTKELAHIDDMTKFYANKYRSPNYYFYVKWSANYIKPDDNNFLLDDITDKFLTNFKTNIDGWQPRFLASQSEMTGVDISEIEMHFPGNSESVKYMKYDPAEVINDFNFAGLKDVNMYMNFNENIIKQDGSSYGSNNIDIAPFSGGYTLKINDVVKARFDAYGIEPYTQGSMSDAKFDKQPLLLVKLNSDPQDNTKISSATWKFSRYDNSLNQYVDLSDEAVKLYFEQSKSTIGVSCSLRDSSNNRLERVKIRSIDTLTKNNITLDFDNSVSKNDIGYLASSFMVLGNEYDFLIELD